MQKLSLKQLTPFLILALIAIGSFLFLPKRFLTMEVNCTVPLILPGYWLLPPLFF